jgi:hypothetical protein
MTLSSRMSSQVDRWILRAPRTDLTTLAVVDRDGTEGFRRLSMHNIDTW